MRAICQCVIGLVCLFLFSFTPVFADSTFVKFGSAWKYYDNTLSVATGWKETAFNDEGWSSGPSAFGYGNGSVRTTISFGNDPLHKLTTTYFRKQVSILKPADFRSFRVSLYVGDGAVIYINGKEAARPNIQAGTVTPATLATQSNVDAFNVITTVDIASSFFRDGMNTIAVETHKRDYVYRSMIFDLELAGVSEDVQVVRGPMLQMVNTTGITIKWKTNTPSSSLVRYGLNEELKTGFVADSSQVTDHELTIKGLSPDTRYYYGIGAKNYILKGSYRTSFNTAPLQSATRKIRLAVIGDAGTGDLNQKRSRDRYLETIPGKENADLALFLGDNAYPLGTDKDYQGGFFNIYNDNLLNNHSIFSVPGNHEYAGVAQINDIAYYKIFSLPKNGESGGVPSGTESYYSFNYGNVHFLMLNSYGLDGGKVLYDTTGEQAVWLKKDLAANAGKFAWTIVCMHHPPYSNGSHSSDAEGDLRSIRERITPILERYNVDLVLAGHSHGFERSYLIKNHTGNSNSFNPAKPPLGNLLDSSSAKYDGSSNSCPYIQLDSAGRHGTMYVVAGAAGQLGGGANPKWPLFYFRNYAATADAETGLMTLDIEDNRIDGKYIGASTGKVLDRFTMMKGVGKRSMIVEEVNAPLKLNASWSGNYSWTSTNSAVKNDVRSLNITAPVNGSATYYVRDNAVESMSCITDTFVIRSYAAASAVNIQFTATQTQNEVLLKWTTEQEFNTDFFLIERSANGTDYTQIGTVAGADISSLPTDYKFEDKTALQGKNYYRLTRVTKNGRKSELGVRTINFLASYSVKVAPFVNPSPSNKVELIIHNNSRQMLELNIVDLLGASVYTRQWTIDQGVQTLTIKLRAGSYIISGKTMDGAIPSERLIVY